MKTSKILITTSLAALLSSFGLIACGGSEVEPADQSQQAGLAQPAAPAASNKATRPDGKRDRREAHDGHRGPPSPDKLMERFDANKDGQLEASELPERMKAHLKDIDTNGDGNVSKEELAARFETMRAEFRTRFEERAKARFAEKDANHDGVLDASEVGSEHWARLSVADANGDQKLTPEELKAAFESGKLRPMRGHHHFGGGHDDAPSAAPPAAAPTQ